MNKGQMLIFDARGNGNGQVCCSIVGGHQATISDYTAIVLEIKDADELGWHTDRTDIDKEQCRGGTTDA